MEMRYKARLSPQVLEMTGLQPLVRAYFEISQLKQLYRQGWLHRGIQEAACESVAVHTFGMAVLAMLIADQYFPGLDSTRVLRMALVHDIGEVYAGDIVPGGGVAKEEKQRLEREAVRRIFQGLPNGDQYLAAWEEFEQGETPEARLVKQVDRLEMALQASVYEHMEYGRLQEFFETAALEMLDPELIALMDAVQASRKAYPDADRK